MKLKLFILLLVLSFLLVLGLLWLAIGVAILGGLFFLFTSNYKFGIYLRKKAAITTLLTISGVFILAICARIFLIEVYSIPSGSMKGTLLPGDKVLVSKINYGPRMPYSPFEVAWVNLFFYLNKEARASIDSTWYNYKRLNGFSIIKRNDIIVFNFPQKRKTFFIKRCIGMPGEKLEIKNGIVTCNSTTIDFPIQSILKYRLYSNNTNEFFGIIDSLDLPVYNFHNNREEKFQDILLNQQQALIFKKSPFIDSIHIAASLPDTIPHTYPHNHHFLWTFENFGMVSIPKKGMRIQLTPENYYLYQKIFDNYERQNFTIENNKVLNDGIPVYDYTFKQDYFFMMGDNRYQSYDSRGWGFVPEEAIVGKAVAVLFSTDYNKLRWHRLFERLE
jgi:signal peptidase I